MDHSSPTLYRDNNRIVLPGLATAHSHAFQRALRGRTQRRATSAGSFWSWRGLMYALAETLDPDDIFHIARFAFVELAMSGVTAVGEFHYIHHGPGGVPYKDRTILAEAVIRAAREAGLRITLIRTAYVRAGYDKPLEPAQQRFSDVEVDAVLADVATLTQRHADDPMVRIALAAHSIRAVPREQVLELAAYTRQQGLPFHMHVAEQPAEIEECLQEYGLRPVELLAQAGVLDERFVGIHATHLSPAEIEALGQANAFVCLCRTTERDLGDGLPETAALVQAGVKLCVGVDSHASSDAFEEIRAVELDDRSRTEARQVAAEAPALLRAATQAGYQAIGLGDGWQEDTVYLNAADASLAGSADELLTDAVIFGATPRAVDEVTIGGQTVVNDGIHLRYAEALRGYETTLHKLGLL
jgi:formiminoglutamate deiminase